MIVDVSEFVSAAVRFSSASFFARFSRTSFAPANVNAMSSCALRKSAMVDSPSSSSAALAAKSLSKSLFLMRRLASSFDSSLCFSSCCMLSCLS